MKSILVTDSLFIFDEHIAKLREAGYEVVRLDKPEATEEELCEAVKGKAGYILGGIEHITEKVIISADKLEVITFTGADWASFIPAHNAATKEGIAITNTPGANAYAVAEYSITLILAMTRRVFELGLTGDKTFLTTNSLKDISIGVIGMGRIGEQVARMLIGLGATKISYWNRTRKQNLEEELGITYESLERLFDESEVVTNHLSSSAGRGFIDGDLLSKLSDQSIIVNTGYQDTFNMDSLYDELNMGRIRAAFDIKSPERFKKLPLATWFSSNEHTAYNTTEANRTASDMAVESIINILNTGDDKLVVNKEFKNYKL